MTLRSKAGGKEGRAAEAVVAQAELPRAGAREELSFKFGSEAAQKAFSYIVDAFIDDYMHKKIALESSGWRTLVDTIKHGGVPKSGVYSAHGGIGEAISELENRGLVEIRVFPGERGRGGRILKVRLAYEKETVKRYVDQIVMKK
jgi:hypothetical protein